MYDLLKKYRGPSDIQAMSLEELNQLAMEIRQFLIQAVSRTGGHLAPNLGVVELTMALHNVFDFTEDRLVFDVGHQSYVHKILTGRLNQFSKLRKYQGLAGFPKTSESVYDHFNTGHASTSISAALGMARARDIQEKDHHVVCVIGDGAFNGGMVWESLNDVGFRQTKLIIVLNDNEMSISPNVGSMSQYLSRLRSDEHYHSLKKGFQETVEKLPIGRPIESTLRWVKDSFKAMVVEQKGMIFENMGIKYLGPVDGHNIKEMSKILKAASAYEGPVIIHAVTQKGRGYSFAVKNPDKFHGVAPFEPSKGEPRKKGARNYSKEFGQTMIELAGLDDRICTITAAMPDGTGLTEFSHRYPHRFFDVGIAEEHAVTLAAGMAMSGLKPFVAIYSTFLQRSLDQVIHDVAIQNLNVTFCLDRAGIVGDDGETHQGAFDISYLSMIPSLTVMAPKNLAELSHMLYYAKDHRGPLAIRYPRGGDEPEARPALEIFEPGAWEPLTETAGARVLIVATGKFSQRAYQVAENLRQAGQPIGAYHLPFLKPLVPERFPDLSQVDHIITLEDGILRGGFGEGLMVALHKGGYQGRVHTLGYDDCFVEQGDVAIIYKKYGLDQEGIESFAKTLLEKL